MYQPDDPHSPAERAKRRRLFSSRPSGETRSELTPPEGPELIEQMMESYKAAVHRQLEEGLSAIRHRVAQPAPDPTDKSAEDIGGQGMPLAAEDMAALRGQLADIARQVAGALQALAERDQDVIESVRSSVLEHGQLITSETTRISRAMETYVQHGVEAMGRLAGSMEAQVSSLTSRDDAIADRVREIVEPQSALLGEQLQLMVDRLAIGTAEIAEATNRQAERELERGDALSEQVQLMFERMAIDARSITDAISELNTAMSQRIVGFARLVRSDAEALRSEILRTGGGDDGRVAAIVDERLAHVNDELEAGTTRLAEELTRGIAEARQSVMQDLTHALEQHARVAEERARAMEGRLDATAKTLDVKLAEKVEGLARLVRSDNVTLAEQVSAGQGATKQTLRAVKELQANLPGDVIDVVEQRLASLAETIERSNETLGKRIDLVADTIGRRQDSEIQVVIDRMGDAMHALAGLGREAPPGRFELEERSG